MVKKDNCWRMKKKLEGKDELWGRSDDVYLFFYPHGNVAEISALKLGALNASLKKLTILLTMGRMARKYEVCT